jgi:hypothetical protein
MSQDKLYSLNLISNENIFLINLNYEQPINNLTIKNCKEKCTQKNKMQREYLNKFEVFFLKKKIQDTILLIHSRHLKLKDWQ